MKRSDLKIVTKFIIEILSSFAAPFEVLTHHTFGVRYMTPTIAIAMAGFWLIAGSFVAFTMQSFGVGNPFLLYFYALFIGGLAMYHAQRALRKERKQEWIHTYSSGHPWFYYSVVQKLGIGMLRYKRYGEPLVALLIALLFYLLSFLFPEFLLIAAFYLLCATSVAIRAEMSYRHALDLIRNERDITIESRVTQEIAQLSDQKLSKLRHDQSYESEGYEMVVPDFVPVTPKRDV